MKVGLIAGVVVLGCIGVPNKLVIECISQYCKIKNNNNNNEPSVQCNEMFYLHHSQLFKCAK